MELLEQTENLNYLVNLIKNCFIIYFTYYTSLRIMNKKSDNIKTTIVFPILVVIISILYIKIRYSLGLIIGIIFIISMLSCIISYSVKNNIGYAIIITIISLSINYLIFFISVIISFIPNYAFGIKNNLVGVFVLIFIYSILIYLLSSIKRFKKGLSFLEKNSKNERFDIIVLSISSIILFFVVMISNYSESITDKIGYALIIFAIIMFITIQKSLQIYYKQKLLVQELEETKNELEKKNKEIKELEQENLNFSKTSHTLAHKQKALEYKLNQLINQSAKNEPTKNNTNASREDNITHQANKPENIETEQIQDIKERLAEISKDLYQNEKSTRLAQTGIKRIDNMLEYMQSESEKYNIKLELQITGNIHHMTNKIIEEKDLETLIADHVKNAIIAINHSKNENKSILVKLGKIEENYGLAIYDTGIEFENETLENLGKKPSTTHAEEGGTGMGFMNTFDTINKYKASLIINEIGKESETNYTKAIIIKFDQKNEFKIDSYRQ